jgi:CheY-like chemotaxis protein
MREGPDTMRVLVVDADHPVADTLGLVVRAQGHIAKVVYSAEDGIVLAQNFVPHAVLADVMLPGMNGIDFASYLAAHYPDCRVLLASGDAAAFELAEQAACDGYCPTVLPKPVHPAILWRFSMPAPVSDFPQNAKVRGMVRTMPRFP